MYPHESSKCLCEAKVKHHRCTRSKRCRKEIYPDKVKRRQATCVLCQVTFSDVDMFECHLNTDEHKLNDAPLAFILQRVENAKTEGSAPEYRILRRQAKQNKTEESSIDEQPLDLSCVTIGAECISQKTVSFCGVCKVYIYEDEEIGAHLKSLEHLTRFNTKKYTLKTPPEIDIIEIS